LSTLPEQAAPPLTLDDIDTGLPVVQDVARPGPQDLMERASAERAQLENKLARSRIKNVKADRRMRKTYAGRILRYLEIYSGCVLGLIVLSGFKIWGFALLPEVLATLVGSTAIAAIGLVGFIARGLFRPPPENSN
jgi:hypothetical protein